MWLLKMGVSLDLVKYVANLGFHIIAGVLALNRERKLKNNYPVCVILIYKYHKSLN